MKSMESQSERSIYNLKGFRLFEDTPANKTSNPTPQVLLIVVVHKLYSKESCSRIYL